jgi:hypothetical protein
MKCGTRLATMALTPGAPVAASLAAIVTASHPSDARERVSEMKAQFDDKAAEDVLKTLGRRLRGARGAPDEPDEPLLAGARSNRVQLLLAGALDRRDPKERVLWSELADEYREAAARDAADTAALAGLLTSARAHGVSPLVIKGAALAHLVYERSWERPRWDADLFIAERDAPALCRALEAAGYRRAPAVDGPLVTGQFQYSALAPGRMAHHVDVHTRLFNPVAFSRALEWGDADSRAVPLPALGPAARTLAMPDALLVACVHRVAHHHDEPDLIWLCDVDRLARRLPAREWTAFASRAAQARVAAVCRSSLQAAAVLLEAPVPSDVLALLDVAGESSSAFLGRGAGELAVQRLNFSHASGWRDRASLVRQHIFPPAAYVLEKYGRRSRAWLPLLYAYRVIHGAPRWLRGR